MLLKAIAVLLLLSLPFNSFATSAEERGLEIAKEMDRRDTGWVDQQATLVMTLRNKQGDETDRENRMRTMEVMGDGDKSLIIFDTPADVKGTAFLMHTHALKNDDQWLYLPALKRVKRVSSSNKSGPFMGSDGKRHQPRQRREPPGDELYSARRSGPHRRGPGWECVGAGCRQSRSER